MEGEPTCGDEGGSGRPLSNEERDLTRAAISRLSAGYDDDRLTDVCRQGAKAVLPDLHVAAAVITDEVCSALSEGRPFSLIRAGHGEGSALGIDDPGIDGRLALRCFQVFFYQMHGTWLDDGEARSYAERLASAIRHATVAGFRSIDRGLLPGRLRESDLVKVYAATDEIASLGMLAAARFLETNTQAGCFRQATLTSAWIHIGLLPLLQRIFECASEVIAISGRVELADAFERRLENRPHTFIAIPGEGHHPQTRAESHYAKHFPQIEATLKRTDLRGKLVLVGAGLLGKIYCDAAREGGGVAIDAGSMFDLLANQTTRPIHPYVNFQPYTWV